MTQGAVSQWIKRGKEGGEAGLAEQPKSGVPLRLSAADRQKLPGLLERGAESFGFRGDLWTCARVGKLIEREFGVKYHPAHVSRILKDLVCPGPQPGRMGLELPETC